MRHEIHGFCIYIKSYTGYYLNIWTLKDLIELGIKEYEDEKRKIWLKEHNTNLRKKVIEAMKNPNDKESLEIFEYANSTWPYLGSRCPHSLDPKDGCGMCVNGCDFY